MTNPYANNKRPLKYDEPKKARTLHLTDTAWEWLKQNGMADFIEKKARLNKKSQR